MIDKDIDEESVGEIAKRKQLKRKTYHRHSPHQIQQMEEFFRDCPHPNKKQRNELSQDLGMEPLQVKFWFQNKRTIMKAKHEHQVNTHLRVENDKLRSENMRYKEALENACCPACGFVMTTIGDVPPDERHLRIENARLREEIHRISAAAAKYVGKPITIYEAAAPSSSSSMPPLTDLKSTEKKAFSTEDCEKSKNSAPSRMETKK